MYSVYWDIQRSGRAWKSWEVSSRKDLRPEKLEIWEGKLLFSHEERVNLLGLLLENVGADQAVRLGRPEVWAEALRAEFPWLVKPRLHESPETWMLIFGSFYLLCLAVILFLADEGSGAPPVALFFMTVSVSALVSLGVNAFLKL